MRERFTAESLLAERRRRSSELISVHAAELDRIRIGIADANLAAEQRSRQLCSETVDIPAAEPETGEGYPLSWLV